ncbi:glycosyltransferase [Treponema primitia]|uniref:glycosyltransferase n=1 Tax=Treponema primitia TaxID=88058 RepID=UPI000684216C|nr:glycosyltransferase [Treponema primitia]
MKILLVTRGSQGDIYPYLALAAELMRRGHRITISLPRLFEEQAKALDASYFLQSYDDIAGMVEGNPSTKDLLDWTARVIDSQFDEMVPLLEEHDLLVCSNTEFAASHVAEYCGKPHIRTCYAPLIPGKRVPPAVLPFLKPPYFLVGFQWTLLNAGLNLMVKKNLNKNRAKLNMAPIKDQGEYAPANARNYLMYSPHLGETDAGWNYSWSIGGYCFNDTFPYNEIALKNCIDFIKKDSRPTIFFTLGSCNAEDRDTFCERLFEICCDYNYKLVVGCGWWKVGTHLHNQDNLFLLDSAIPHYFILPECDAIIHHGGSGTTHSAARSGKPQMVVPLLIDQFYWGSRAASLGLGPRSIKIRIGKKALEEKILDLVKSPVYRQNAAVLGEKIRGEQGILNMCEFIEKLALENHVGLKTVNLPQ